MSGFTWPDRTQRLAVMGRTGSGKTRFGVYALSKAAYTRQPYVIIDYKRDDLINAIPYANEISLKELPKTPGIYIIHPDKSDDEHVENWLRAALRRENIGIMIDEAFEIPQREPRYTAFKAVLSQGRAKSMPVIACFQRPAHINRSVLSESEFFAVFHLQSEADRKRVYDFSPSKMKLEKRIDDYHCRWYDVKRDFICTLSPVPNDDVIKQEFEERLKPRRKVF